MSKVQFEGGGTGGQEKKERSEQEKHREVFAGPSQETEEKGLKGGALE